MKNSRIPHQLSMCAIAAFLSACGGGDASAPTIVVGANGFAVDDYIRGATVLCDTNSNSNPDAGEATTTTDSSGFFKFSSTCTSSLVVTGGTNIDTGLPFIGKLKAPVGSTVVTPLTTLLSEGMTNDQIVAALGLQPGTNVTSDDPARKISGTLQRSDLFKKTLAMQQLLQKTAETLAALIPGADASKLYSDVSAAMAGTLRTNPTLITSGRFDQNAIAALVQASATRLQSSLGSGVNPASLAAVISGALKVQGDRILGSTDSNLTATTLSEQSSNAIRDFVNTNKSGLGVAPGAGTTTLGNQLTSLVTGSSPPPPPPPPEGSTLLVNFDETPPRAVTEFGGAGYAVGLGPDGGTANVLKIARNGGEVYAGAWISIPAIPSNTGARTVTARVYSPTAGIPMVAKAEFGDNQGTGNVQANQAVIVGWQTLSWTFTNLDSTKVYNRFTILPNLETVDTTKDYYFDDITLLAAAVAPPPAPTSCATSSLQCLSFSESTAGVSGFGDLVTAELANDPVAGASNKVVKLVKNAPGDNFQPWAGATVRTSRTGSDPNFVDTIDRIGLGTSKTVTMRSYSSAPVGTKITLKLENGLDPTKFVITEALTTSVNTWETLTFNFANLTNGTFDSAQTYNKASILPGWTEVGGTSSLTAQATFYFDELKYSVYSASTPPPPPPAPAPSTALASFDENPALAVNVFGGVVTELAAGPAGSGAGTGNALKITRNGGEVWAGAWVAIPAVPNNAGSQKVTAKVYSPTAGIPFVAKLEFGDNQGTGIVQANETVVAGWQTLSWTFTNLTAPNVYNRFVVIPNFETVDSNKIYYIDDVNVSPVSSGGGGSGGALTFSSGFSSAVLTASNGAVASAGGSDLDGFGCSEPNSFCGSFFGGAGADSYAGFFYETISAPSALYSQMEVFGPGITGFNAGGDTGGITLGSQTKVNFTFNQNPEWFNSSNNKFAVVITLGKRYAIDGGCRLQLHGVKTPTADTATAYSMNLRSDFRVAADCGAGIPPTDVAAALAASPVISSIKFMGAAGGAAIFGRDNVASGANLSTAAGNTRYPTTVVLKGAITFD